MKNIFGLAVLLAVSLSCGGFFTQEEVRDIREVRVEYSKSMENAREKFDGKEIVILGVVTYRSEVSPSLKIGSRTDNDIPATVPDVECVYDEADVLFRNVTADQVVKIRGVLKVSDGEMKMEPCKLEPF